MTWHMCTSLLQATPSWAVLWRREQQTRNNNYKPSHTRDCQTQSNAKAGGWWLVPDEKRKRKKKGKRSKLLFFLFIDLARGLPVGLIFFSLFLSSRNLNFVVVVVVVDYPYTKAPFYTQHKTRGDPYLLWKKYVPPISKCLSPDLFVCFPSIYFNIEGDKKDSKRIKKNK